jgi:Uma2 family endonuclease
LIRYPAVELDPRRRYTYADCLTWADDVRRELIDGIVYVLSAPRRIHAGISSNTFFQFFGFIKRRKGKCKVYHAPFDVRLPLDGATADDRIYTVVQPDICVVCDPAKLDDKGCLGAPDLVVEVLSPSTGKRDLNEKFDLYEAAGVKEYWVVYPDSKALNVFILQPEGKYDFGTVYEKCGKVPVHIFKGLEIDLDEMFSD